MKKLFFLCLIASFKLAAQAPGTLDLSFGNGGKVVTSLTAGQDKAYGVAIQTDGKIVVAGSSNSTITGKDFSVARYLTTGTIDSSFGTNGIVTTDLQLGSEDVAYGLALQTDGKMVLAGYTDDGSNKDAALIRYHTNGTIDSSFGTNGIVITDFENGQQDEIKAIKIHAITGNIVVGGSSAINSNLAKPVVARYTSTGALDNTFDNNGIRLMWITGSDSQYYFCVEDIIVQPNGKIHATGWRDYPISGGQEIVWAGRINSNGSMDNTFSADGVTTYNAGLSSSNRAHALLLQADGDIVLSGTVSSGISGDFYTLEIPGNGMGFYWLRIHQFGSNDIAYDLERGINGNIVLAGSSGTSTDRSFALARLSASGIRDHVFGGNGDGRVTTTFNGNALNECFDAAIQTDNKIVAVGYAGDDFAIARYLGTGVTDLNGFQLISPADMTMNLSHLSVAFDWSDAFGATSYELELDTTSLFGAGTQTFTTSTSADTVNNLMDNKQYFWRVRASDGNNTGNYSATWSFTTKLDTSSSIQAIDFANLSIYPNPTSDFVTVETVPNLLQQPYQVLDNTGKVILAGIIETDQLRISLSDFPTGIYFLQIGTLPQQTFQLLKE